MNEDLFAFNGEAVAEAAAPVEKKCAHCGKEFRPSKNDKRIRFCSKSCQKVASPAKARERAAESAARKFLREKIPEKACAHCGEMFKPYQDNPIYRFCSTVCRVAAESAARKSFREAIHEKPCDHCGKPFKPRGNSPKFRFCSEDCQCAATSAAQKAARKAKREAIPEKPCAHCGEPFKPKLSNKHYKFCSPRCQHAARCSPNRHPPIVYILRMAEGCKIGMTSAPSSRLTYFRMANADSVSMIKSVSFGSRKEAQIVETHLLHIVRKRYKLIRGRELFEKNAEEFSVKALEALGELHEHGGEPVLPTMRSIQSEFQHLFEDPECLKVIKSIESIMKKVNLDTLCFDTWLFGYHLHELQTQKEAFFKEKIRILKNKPHLKSPMDVLP